VTPSLFFIINLFLKSTELTGYQLKRVEYW